MEYRCWVESGGVRTPIGKMFFAGDVAYWVGEVPDADSLPEDATFGVSAGRPATRATFSADPSSRARPDEPAAPTRPDADIHATDEATAPPLDDALAARGEAPTTPGEPPRPVEAGRSAEIAAAFDELAPVYDRMASILSLGLDRRWRSAVVAETRLTPGDSAIDVAAGTGRLATDLADRVGPFGRIVAVDLSPAMVERGAARSRDIVQLEFVLGDALRAAVRRRPVRRGDDLVRAGRARRPGRGHPRAVPGRPARRPRRLPRADDAAAPLVGPAPAPDGEPPGAARGFGRRAPRRLSPAQRVDAERAGRRFARRPARAAGLVDVRYRRLSLGAVAIHSGSLPPG
jgi:hypothetical protein